MIEEVLLRRLGTTVGQQVPFALNERLVDLGIDSQRFVQLVVQLEYDLGVEFADENLDYKRFERISDVLAYLKELTSRTTN